MGKKQDASELLAMLEGMKDRMGGGEESQTLDTKLADRKMKEFWANYKKVQKFESGDRIVRTEDATTQVKYPPKGTYGIVLEVWDKYETDPKAGREYPMNGVIASCVPTRNGEVTVTTIVVDLSMYELASDD